MDHSVQAKLMKKSKAQKPASLLPPDVDPLPNEPSGPVNPLDSLNPEELVSLSDQDFQGKVRKHARSRTAEAMNAIEEVMNGSDDDQARLMAATKMLKIAKAEDEEQKSILPFGVSEEVFRIALAGLGKLAGLASLANPSMVLRNVTPASTDPRPFIPDDSPLNAPLSLESKRLMDENTLIEENLQDAED